MKYSWREKVRDGWESAGLGLLTAMVAIPLIRWCVL